MRAKKARVKSIHCIQSVCVRVRERDRVREKIDIEGLLDLRVVRIKDLDKINLVKLAYGGKVLGTS